MERDTEEQLMAREETCRKACKTVGKAIFMRLFVTVLLIWALSRTQAELWVIGLMAFVLILNLSGMLPLVSEWKRQHRELKHILSLYE